MRFRLACVLLLVFTLLGLKSVAQSRNTKTTGLLQVSVSDSGERAPIRYAFILIHQHSGQEDEKPALDSGGRFNLRLAPGLYDVFVAADSFAPECKKVKIVAGQTTKFDVTLRPDSVHLESRLDMPHPNL